MKASISSFILKINNDIKEISSFDKFYQKYFKLEFINNYFEISTFTSVDPLTLNFKLIIQNKETLHFTKDILVLNKLNIVVSNHFRTELSLYSTEDKVH